MKTKIYIVALLMVALPACDSLVQPEPESFLTPANYYDSEKDAIAAINAVYSLLNEGGLYNNNLWYPLDMSTDDMLAGTGVNNPDIRAIDTYTHGPVNGKLYGIWRTSYRAINRANAVIERVPEIDMDPTLRERIVGEARFLRALMYFNLVRLFGDVPLIVTETTSLGDLNAARTPSKEVYTLIVEDLQAAEAVLPGKGSYSGSDIGRATRGAAKALLAKVYLTLASEQANNVYPERQYSKGTQAYYQLAAEKAREVIDSGNYALREDFADVFALENENGKESIFSVQFKSNSGGEGSSMPVFNIPRNTPLGRGFGSNVPTEDLVESFQEGDERKAVTFFSSYTMDNGETLEFDRVYFFKYFDEDEHTFGSSDNNYPVLRYSDVLLMYAEALNGVNGGPTSEAYAAINKVRERAELSPLRDLNQAEFRKAVWRERRWEFVYEGQRWFDLVRTGRLVEVLRANGNTNVQEYHTLWPIPQREIDANPLLKQNPGY